jgi:uroporphyrinogen-III decarboxylase
MSGFTTWRGYDLSARIRKIERTFGLEDVTSPEDVPVLVNTPCYFAFGSRDKPADYFTDPASMLAYQAHGYEEHLRCVQDDYVPYFMPWFGTGVLASAFGCEIRTPDVLDDDPAVAGPCLHSPADAARLTLPDAGRAGWMPRVLDAIDYARANGDLPVGLTDMQGPLDTLGLMCGQVQLYQWMYDEPRMVRELFELVTEAFIQWVKLQKEHIGEPLERSNGLQGVYSPGAGVWESDDDMILVGARLYEEFALPGVARICATFGGGSVHFCGNGLHHVDNLLRMKSIKVVNNSPLSKFATFAALKRKLAGRLLIQIQDGAPLDVESYYTALFDAMDDFRGVLLAPFVIDNVRMSQDGGYVAVDQEPFETANRIVAITRECVRRKLAQAQA